MSDPRTQTDRRSTRSPIGQRSGGPLGAEAYALVLLLGAHVHHLREVESHGAVLGLELVPAAVPERLVKLLQLLIADPQREHLAALEADAHTAHPRHQRATSPAVPAAGDPAPWWAGSTSSRSTRPVERGSRKATRAPPIPTRGVLSISSSPAWPSSASADSMSETW